MRQRYDQLDSLRGLAALAVLNSHFLNVLPYFTTDIHNEKGLWLVKLIRYTPLRFIYAGQESVMLFFVLSGFVLSLPFFNENQPFSYVQFTIRRVCRIYIPYIVSIITAMLLSVLIHTKNIDSLSGWFNNLNWHKTITSGVLLNHILLVGQFDTTVVNNVIWSLVQEMRISLVFPLLMLLVLRFNWITNVIFGVVLSVCGMTLMNIIGPWTITFHYMIMFIAGAIIAKYRFEIVNVYKRFNKYNKILLFGLGFLMFSYFRIPNWGFEFIRGNENYIKMLTQWGQSIGACIFIVAALSSGLFSKFLSLPLVHYFGKISYSLYLFHCIILIAGINLLYSSINNIWVTLGICFIATLVISTLAYRYIEIPSIKLGRAIISSKKAKQATASNI